MSAERDKDSSASSGPEIPTPTTSNPPSPLLTASVEPPTNSLNRSHNHLLLALAALYPLTILLGSLFSIIAPNGQAASYFSRKTNVFNVFFVKNGWFWTTFAFVLHLFNSKHPNATQVRVNAAIRWVVATIFWIFVTQWCFGPPIMDRTFTMTGGSCQPRPGPVLPTSSIDDKLSVQIQEVFTSAACKVAGGRWSGGHDLSGHTFMLTHASLFLWAEMLPRLLDGRWRGNLVSGSSSLVTIHWFGVHWFTWALLGLWWWMLLMTSVYFHTWPEKVCYEILFFEYSVTNGSIRIIRQI